MKQKAPIGVLAPIGAVITTAEAMETCKPIMSFQAVELKRRFHDLSQLPYRM